MIGGVVINAPERVDPRSGIAEHHGASADSTFLSERTPEKHRVQFRIATVGEEQAEEGDSSKAKGESEPIEFKISDAGSRATILSPLRESFAALGRVRASSDATDWLEASATLRHDAVRLRRTTLARHSSVLLALSDALTFTAPGDPTLEPNARAALLEGISLLREPFIGEPEEESFLVGLLEAGWNLAPSFEDEYDAA